MKNTMQEFKDFIMRGNVLDMAVGVIMGGAFGKIVSSLVDNILMPLIGVLTGGIDVSGLAFTVEGASVGYGLFLQNVIDFLIVAFCMFMMLKAMAKFSFKKKEEEEAQEEEVKEEVSDEVKLLTEIKDLLAAKQK